MFSDSNKSPLDIETSLLDCVQANLAAVADRLHSKETAFWLGAVIRFRPRWSVRGPDDRESSGLPTIEPTLANQLVTAGPLIGLGYGAPGEQSSPGPVFDAAREQWQLVIADAYDLSWVPYYRNNHTGHSFAVRATGADEIELLDAYTNDTPFGPARPSIWTVTKAELDDALAGLKMTVVSLSGAPIARPPAAELAERTADELALAHQDGRTSAYLKAYADYADQAEALRRFTVETWLLARQRKAHAHWLAEVPGFDVDVQPVEQHAQQWVEAAEATYMAMRRAQRGRAAPAGVYQRVADLLGEDGHVLRQAARGARVGSS